MKTFFTSDFHLGHENILRYCDRPFDSVYEMNETIIRNHNMRVKMNDRVFFLGDFCFRNTKGGKAGEGMQTVAEDYREQLNGDIVFIRGNHDNNNSLNTKINSLELEMFGTKLFLVHNPADYNKQYKINVVGHVHNLWQVKRLGWNTLINVGVDVNKFMPVRDDELYAIIQRNGGFPKIKDG